MKNKNKYLSPRKKLNKPALIAHRGGNEAGKEKENTLAAFSSAVKLGYKYLETDVILSKDGQVVAFHGSANLYQELKTGLMMRSKMQKLTYKEINNQVSAGGEKIPLLVDLLSEIPGAYFSIDAKTREVVEPLIELIKREKVQNRVSITSFSLNRSKTFAMALGEETLAGFCVHPKLAWLFKLKLSAQLNKLSNNGIGLIHFPHQHLDRKVIARAHSQNIQIWAWTVNDAESIERMASLGVDGIISDEIKLLQRSVSSL